MKRAVDRLTDNLGGSRRRYTRRKLLASGVALSALALLGACGGDDEEPEAAVGQDSDSSSEATATDQVDTATPEATTANTDDAATTTEATATDQQDDATSEETATEQEATSTTEQTATKESGTFPITVQHALGETTIPALPERIVAVKDTEPLDSLLAIGLKPVLYGYTDGYQLGRLSSWVQEIGIEDVDRFDNLERAEPDVELIAAANPDLILDVWTAPEVYDQLSGVAPTVVLRNSDNTPWQDVQRLTGKVTGRVDEAEQAIQETESVTAEQAERAAPHAGKTVAIAYEFFGDLLINGAEVAIGRLVEQLGFTVQAPNPAEITFLSLEQWQTVKDADIIMTPEFIHDDLVKQEQNPLFLSLPQVHDGHYIVLPAEVSQSVYLESALSIRWGLPQMTDALIAAAEGKGKKLG